MSDQIWKVKTESLDLSQNKTIWADKRFPRSLKLKMTPQFLEKGIYLALPSFI